MYTQCSHCSTLFRVTPQQLRQAAGMVRCCLCHQPFNALAALSEGPPPELTEYEAEQAAHAPGAAASSRSRSTVERSMAAAAPSSQPVAKAAVQAEPAETFVDGDSDADPRDEADFLDESLEDVWRDEALDPEFVLSSVDEPIDEVGASEVPVSADDDMLEAVDAPAQDGVDEEAGPVLEAAAGELTETEPLPVHFATPVEEVPPASSQGRGWARFVAWGIGALVLVVLLGVQYAYFMRDDLARYPNLRPWLSAMCSVAHCKLPLRRDLNQIKILRGRVLTEPNHPGVLLVRATLVNEAAFAQPYPQLRLTLMDINGNVTGRRWFAPAQYVADTVLRKQMGAGMPPKQPVAVRLELVDPGHNSENFEFDFR